FGPGQRRCPKRAQCWLEGLWASPSPRAGDPHGAPLPSPAPSALRAYGSDPIAARWGLVDQRHRYAMPGLRWRWRQPSRGHSGASGLRVALERELLAGRVDDDLVAAAVA